MRIEELPLEWRERAAELARFAPSAAEAFTAAAEQLEQTLTHSGDEPLSLAAAARESGYSADHLGRLVKQGVIPNAGRPRAPRILRKYLPVKARDGETPGEDGPPAAAEPIMGGAPLRLKAAAVGARQRSAPRRRAS